MSSKFSINKTKKKNGIEKADSSTKIAIRSDINVLVVGDPGLGKSQLLRATSNIAPKGVYVCGNSTTSAGLTVKIIKEINSFSFLPSDI
jgi:DNA helicase MCM8